jgi:antitoxin component of MazEF toxin-antitoxin module
MTTGTLSKWGNGQGVLIPKSYCEKLGVRIGDKLDLTLDDDKIAITPQKRFTIEALMKDYAGPKPQEYDWGAPMGRELW